MLSSPPAVSSSAAHRQQSRSHPNSPRPSLSASTVPPPPPPLPPPPPPPLSSPSAPTSLRPSDLPPPPSTAPPAYLPNCPKPCQVLAAYVDRFLGNFLGEANAPRQSFRHPMHIVFSTIGAFAGIVILTSVHLRPDRNPNSWILIGSFGSETVLFFADPRLHSAQPWNAIVGNTVASVCGVASYKLIVNNDDITTLYLACAVAVASAVFVMLSLKALHPAGGSSALIACLDPRHSTRGWYYVLLPIFLGSLLLLGISMVYNNLLALGLDNDRRYPVYWWPFQPLPPEWYRHLKERYQRWRMGDKAYELQERRRRAERARSEIEDTVGIQYESIHGSTASRAALADAAEAAAMAADATDNNKNSRPAPTAASSGNQRTTRPPALCPHCFQQMPVQGGAGEGAAVALPTAEEAAPTVFSSPRSLVGAAEFNPRLTKGPRQSLTSVKISEV